MKNKCIVCGKPCRNKYCSKECQIILQKQKYREKHPYNRKFYVFYDKNDFVKCCGTAKELVEQGAFRNERYVTEVVAKIKRKMLKGNVVILPLIEKEDDSDE